MGYRLNRLDEPVFMAGPKPMRTESGIHLRLESCEVYKQCLLNITKKSVLKETLDERYTYLESPLIVYLIF